MHTDDFTKDNSNPIKKCSTKGFDKESSNKHETRFCNENLGTFIFKAPYYPCTKRLPHNCCYNAKKDICFSPCEMIKKEFIDVCPSCDGRLLILHVNLKSICPNKKIVVGVLIYENNKLYAFKTKKMCTGCFNKCRNFDAGDFCFVFKEDELCRQRRFKTKVIWNYVKS